MPKGERFLTREENGEMENRKILFTAPEKAEVVACPMPEIGPDEVLIETDYTVISAGTEKANLLDTPNVGHQWPKHLGYSGSGHIIAVGDQVKDYQVGDRVLTDHLGHQAFVKASFRPNKDGFFKVSEGIDQLDAAMVVVGSMGVQGARKTKLQLGEAGMVTGLGILGMFAVQAMKNMGAMPLIAVDFDANRRAIALKLGADYALDPAEPDFEEQVCALTEGRMINANVEVTGSAAALLQCLKVAAWEGRITLTGCTRKSDVPIDYYSMVHRRGVQLIGAHNFVRPVMDSYPGYWTRHDDFAMIMRAIRLGKMQVRPVITDVISTEDAPRVYRELCEEKTLPLGRVFDWHR